MGFLPNAGNRVSEADPPRGARSDYATVTARTQEAGTVLTCAIADAAALTGMIAVLADLGLTVRDVHEVTAGSSGTRSRWARTIPRHPASGALTAVRTGNRCA